MSRTALLYLLIITPAVFGISAMIKSGRDLTPLAARVARSPAQSLASAGPAPQPAGFFSAATSALAIRALFGAFLAGTIIPRLSGPREKLTVRLENVSSVLLLPVFFVFTGQRKLACSKLSEAGGAVA